MALSAAALLLAACPRADDGAKPVARKVGTPKVVTIEEIGPQKSAPGTQVPPALQPSGMGPYFWLTARGTQNYKCAFADAGSAAWSAAVPEAVLYYPGTEKVFGRHFAGPTWEKDDDQSAFAGSKAATDGFVALPSPEDAGFDIPWLLVPKKSASDGGVFAPALFIQRLDTEGGLVTNQPQACDAKAADAGLSVKVPYRAKYVLLRAIGAETKPSAAPPGY